MFASINSITASAALSVAPLSPNLSETVFNSCFTIFCLTLSDRRTEIVSAIGDDVSTGDDVDEPDVFQADQGPSDEIR